MDYWKDWPPLHVIVNPLLSFMGCKPAGGTGAGSATEDNAGLLSALEGAGLMPG